MKKYFLSILLILFFVFSYGQNVKITPHYLSLQAGTSYKLSIYSNQSISQIKWISNNPLVTVNQAGVITALHDTLGSLARAEIIAKDTITNSKDTCFITIVSWVTNQSKLVFIDTLPASTRIIGTQNDSIVYVENNALYQSNKYPNNFSSDSLARFNFLCDDRYVNLLSTNFGYFIREDLDIYRSMDLKHWSKVFQTQGKGLKYSFDFGFDSINNKGYIFASDYDLLNGQDTFRHCVYRGCYNLTTGTSIWDTVMQFYTPHDFALDSTVFPVIRHIHMMRVDPYTNQVWVGTGDGLYQSFIYYSSDFGNTFHLLGSCSQDYRGLSMIFTPKNIYWNMDTDAKQYLWKIPKSVFLNIGYYPCITPLRNTGYTIPGLNYYITKSKSHHFFPTTAGKTYLETIQRNLNDSNCVIEYNNPLLDYRIKAAPLINNALWYSKKVKDQNGDTLYLMTTDAEGHYRDSCIRILGIKERANGSLDIQELYSFPAINNVQVFVPQYQQNDGSIYFYRTGGPSATYGPYVYKAKLIWHDVNDAGEIKITDTIHNQNTISFRLNIFNLKRRVSNWENKNINASSWTVVNDTSSAIYTVPILTPMYYRAAVTDTFNQILYTDSILVINGNTPGLPENPGTINGITNICQGVNNVSYSIPPIPFASSYQWLLPKGVYGISDSNVIIVNFSDSAESDVIRVRGINSIGVGKASYLGISVRSKPVLPEPLSMEDTLCFGQNVTLSIKSILNVNSYQWNVNNSSVTSALTTCFLSTNNLISNTVDVSVKGINACGSGQSLTKSIVILHKPNFLNSPISPVSVCSNLSNSPVVIPPANNAASYIWNLSQGIQGISSENIIYINITDSINSGLIKVSTQNSCGIGDSLSIHLNIKKPPVMPDTIYGPPLVCEGDSNLLFYVNLDNNATSYSWDLPVNLAGNSSTNSIPINILQNAVNYTLNVKSVNSCGISISNFITFSARSKPHLPLWLNAPDTVCANQNIMLSVPYDSNTTEYNWSIPGGIYTTNINNFNTTILGNTSNYTLSAMLSNSCGDSPVLNKMIYFRNLPHLSPPINGQMEICPWQQNLIYTVQTNTDANSFHWTLPGGFYGNSYDSLISIQKDTAVFNTGVISVFADNECGNSNQIYLYIESLPLPQTIGSISGPSIICQNEVNVPYMIPPVLFSSNYQWNAPSGVTVSNSQYNTVNLNFDTSATSGFLTVFGENNCGISAIDSFYINIIPVPQTPVIQQNGPSLESDIQNGNQWYELNSGSIPNAVHQTYNPTQSGKYFAIINSNNCSSMPSNIINFFITATNESETFKISPFVSPSPANEITYLYFELMKPEKAGFSIYTPKDELIFREIITEKSPGSYKIPISTFKYAKGMYFLELYIGNQIKVLKFIVN